MQQRSRYLLLLLHSPANFESFVFMKNEIVFFLPICSLSFFLSFFQLYHATMDTPKCRCSQMCGKERHLRNSNDGSIMHILRKCHFCAENSPLYLQTKNGRGKLISGVDPSPPPFCPLHIWCLRGRAFFALPLFTPHTSLLRRISKIYCTSKKKKRKMS